MDTPFLKYAVIAALSLGLGALAGAFLVHTQLAPQIAELTGRAESLEAEKNKLNEQNKRLMAASSALEAETAGLKAQLRQLSQRPATETSQQQTQDDTLAFDLMQAFQALQDDTPQNSAQPNPENNQDQSGRENPRWTPEERAQRFREFEQRARERVNNVLQQEYAQAPDRATQNRIELLQAYMDQLTQLRDAMRNAQTDEDREVLRQSMRESFGNVRDLVQTQQDSMLRSFAAQNGIKDTEKQNAFIAGLRNLQATPFFQADRMMGGGFIGFGGWNRGRGGDRGGDRGPRTR